MTDQFKMPVGWDSIPIGTQVHPSIGPASGGYVDDYTWRGTRFGFLATIVSTQEEFLRAGYKLAMLNRPLPGCFRLNQLSDAQRHCAPKYKALLSDPKQELFYWIARPSAVRLYDPTYLSPNCARGVFTCECGAMNVDPSISAVFDGKYVCYACRVFYPRVTAA